MNTSLFMKKVLASRLLRPVFLILVVAGVLQVHYHDVTYHVDNISL